MKNASNQVRVEVVDGWNRKQQTSGAVRLQKEPLTVDEEEERKAYRQFTGNDPPPDTINTDRTAKIRKLQRLQPIYDSLPAEWRAKYDQWVREVGVEPEHPEFVTYHSSWTGPNKSRVCRWLESNDSRTGRQLPEGVEAARWKRRDPSPDGLSGSLTAAVAASAGQVRHNGEPIP